MCSLDPKIKTGQTSTASEHKITLKNLQRSRNMHLLPYKLFCFLYYQLLDFQLNMSKGNNIRKRFKPLFRVVIL